MCLGELLAQDGVSDITLTGSSQTASSRYILVHVLPGSLTHLTDAVLKERTCCCFVFKGESVRHVLLGVACKWTV